jgi:hypothetical protein
MTTFNKVLVVAVAASAFAVSANAAKDEKGAKAGGWASFEKVDADRNGMVSKEEAGSVQALDFSKADKNNDGQVSKSEYEAAKKGQTKQKTKPQGGEQSAR